MRWMVFICLAVTMCTALGAAQQQTPTPTFRSTTRLIVETVSVKDKNGTPVEGLTAKDFTITEDGQPQSISFVEFQRLPTTPSQASAAPATTAAPNTPPPASAAAGNIA